MGDWSLMEGQCWDTVGEVLGSSLGTTVTSGAGSNTKGSWVEIIAATTYVADGLLIIMSLGTAGVNHLVDIGIGAVGSEQVIIPNLLVAPWQTNICIAYPIPTGIPAGTRIAARSQSGASGGQTIYVTISLVSQGFLPSAPLHRVTAYGAATADSGGTSVDPGGVANTKNSYSQINGVTTNPIRALLVAIGGANNSARATCYWLVDVAIGAAASEQIIIPDLALGAHLTGDNVLPGVLGPFFIDIPAGVRLAARAQCNIIDATDRLFDIVLYGID